MNEEVCFVCGSNIHGKYLLSNENLKDLEGNESQSEEEQPCDNLETDFKTSKKPAMFFGYRSTKFRRIQKTLFNSILDINPNICQVDDSITEIPAKLCVECEKEIYQISLMQLEIKSLQNELKKISSRILDSVISSTVDYCFSQENMREQLSHDTSQANSTNTKILDDLLPQDSIHRKVYKKWKSKCTKALGVKLENDNAMSAIEAGIEDYYEEEISTTELVGQSLIPSCLIDEIDQENSENENMNFPLKTDDSQNEEVRIIVDDTSPQICKSQEGISSEKQQLGTISSIYSPKNQLQLKTETERSRTTIPKLRNSTITTTKRKIMNTDETFSKIYQCQECGQLCKRKTRLKEHMDIYHNQNIRENGSYRCPECTCGFVRLQHLEYHLSNVHREVEFSWCKQCKIMSRNDKEHVCKTFAKKCPMCEKEFSSLLAYRIHRKEICVRKGLGEKGSKYFSCDLCPKTFNRKQGLIYHKKTHTGEKNFVCEACSKMFTSKNQLQVHQRIHSGEKPYVCDLCGLTFSSTPGLVSHKKTHLGLKPYTCDICSKAFRSLGHLNTHKVIHSGEKPFSCPICQKSFNRKENLRSHEYTHCQTKPHKCTICPSTSFSRANLLRNHMNSRHYKKTSTTAKSAISQKSNLTRVSDFKEMKTQVRFIKGENNTFVPNSTDPSSKIIETSPSKNLAYFVAGNPGKYIVLKNVVPFPVDGVQQD